DTSRLQTLKELTSKTTPHLIADLFRLFVKESPEDFKSLREAIANSQWAEATRIAHSVKSSAANLGANQMARFCENIEKNIQSPQVPVWLEHTEKEFTMAVQEIQEYLNTQK
ncbi:MAG: Hpt domain-containing protein, partial [Pseudobdellovibrionaceae bacterium]